MLKLKQLNSYWNNAQLKTNNAIDITKTTARTREKKTIWYLAFHCTEKDKNIDKDRIDIDSNHVSKLRQHHTTTDPKPMFGGNEARQNLLLLNIGWVSSNFLIDHSSHHPLRISSLGNNTKSCWLVWIWTHKAPSWMDWHPCGQQ